LANWWDAVALWLTDLAFPFQFALVIVVLAPLCWFVAWAMDRVVDLVRGLLIRSAPRPSVRVVAVPVPAKPVVIPVRADVPAGTPARIIASALAADKPTVHS
jgi:hypothetical protein